MHISDHIPLAGLVLLVCLLINNLLHREERKLRHIPTVGYSAPLLTYLTAFRFVFQARDLIQEGYNKYKNGVYKIAILDRWLVLVAEEKLVEELCYAPVEEVSIEAAVDELLQLSKVMGDNLIKDLYHIPIIRSQMTRRLAVIIPDVHDEIATSLSDMVDSQLDNNGCAKLNGFDLVTKITCRAAHRSFVGIPLCRDPQYVKLNTSFIQDFVIEGQILALLPAAVRHFITGLVVRRVPQHIRRGIELLTPLLEQRQQNLQEKGKNYPGKPDDFLSWMLDIATPSEKTIQNIAKRILLMSFTSIPTTSAVLTHALFHLAGMPDVVSVLREEVESIVTTQGWSKSSIAKMTRLDSFLRENQRYQGMAEVSTMRIAVKDFRLSDGTFIPAGTYLKVPAGPIHRDQSYYEDASLFKPFRFVKDDGTSPQQNHYVTTSTRHMGFGHGTHACPGRFFAAAELKIAIGLIVLNYDVGFADGNTRPKNLSFFDNCLPNPTSEIIFKKRGAEW